MQMAGNIILKQIILKPMLAVILFVIPVTSQAQISNWELKGTLLLHFCENVTWRNELPDTFKVGCFFADPELYRFLKPAEKNITIQQRPIQIESVSSLSDIKTFPVIYYGGNDFDDLLFLFNYAKENNTLLVTNNIKDELFIFINFTDDNERLTFKVNMPNLTLAGFSIKPNLLLNGGSVVEINAAYQKFEERLLTNRTKLEQSELALNTVRAELREKDSLLLNKEAQLIQYSEDIKSSERQSVLLKTTIEEERNHIEQQRSELKQSQNELSGLKKAIDLKELEYNKLKANLELLKEQSDTLYVEISQKNLALSEQQARISLQQRMLLLSISLAIAFVLIGFMLYSLFAAKKRNNRILAQKVEERTQELKLSNKHYQTLFNHAPVALWEIDFSEAKHYMRSFGIKNELEYDNLVKFRKEFSIECFRRIRFININKAALSLYGIDNKEELLAIYEVLNAKGELTGLVDEFRLVFLNKVYNTYETRRKNKRGEEIELVITWVDISEERGSFNRVLISLVDITHLRQIERELKKHQEELELLVKEKTDDLESANEELQASNEELYTKNEIINKKNTELKAALQHIKETQAQLFQSEKMASLGVLTAGVAHEINNPLNYIMGAYEGLKVQYAESTDEQTSILLNALEVGLERASNIVKSLNQFSRDNQTLREKCNLHEIIDDSLVMLQYKLKNRIHVIRNYTNEPACFYGNVGNMHQVFLNILTNAEQAIEGEGEIVIQTTSNKQHLQIEISDTGHGIRAENLNRITDPFFTTKDPGQGTGLGLSISYNIISDHHGVLEFDSDPGKGTMVRIVLPINENS
jgi:signal transduction histidine kinase